MSAEPIRRTPVDADHSAKYVIASAAAVVAAAEAKVWKNGMLFADALAARSITRQPEGIAPPAAASTNARWASRRQVHLEQEHNRLAKRSLIAATRAATQLAAGLPVEEYATSTLLADDVASILTAAIVLQESNAAVLAAMAAYNESVA